MFFYSSSQSCDSLKPTWIGLVLSLMERLAVAMKNEVQGEAGKSSWLLGVS